MSYTTQNCNTEKIAIAICEGMKKNGLAADCARIDNIDFQKLVEYDILAIGAPPHAFGISAPMKDFLKKIEKVNLQGKKGFAFDTRLGNRLAGSAAKGIEKNLEKFQVSIVRPHASAIIKTIQGKTVLEENAEKEFERIGSELAAKAG